MQYRRTALCWRGPALKSTEMTKKAVAKTAGANFTTTHAAPALAAQHTGHAHSPPAASCQLPGSAPAPQAPARLAAGASAALGELVGALRGRNDSVHEAGAQAALLELVHASNGGAARRGDHVLERAGVAARRRRTAGGSVVGCSRCRKRQRAQAPAASTCAACHAMHAVRAAASSHRQASRRRASARLTAPSPAPSWRCPAPSAQPAPEPRRAAALGSGRVCGVGQRRQAQRQSQLVGARHALEKALRTATRRTLTRHARPLQHAQSPCNAQAALPAVAAQALPF